jgi:hypothetical protein
VNLEMKDAAKAAVSNVGQIDELLRRRQMSLSAVATSTLIVKGQDLLRRIVVGNVPMTTKISAIKCLDVEQATPWSTYAGSAIADTSKSGSVPISA